MRKRSKPTMGKPFPPRKGRGAKPLSAESETVQVIFRMPANEYISDKEYAEKFGVKMSQFYRGLREFFYEHWHDDMEVAVYFKKR